MAEQPNTLPPDIHMATVIPGDAQNPDGVGPFFPEPDLSGGLPINLDSLRDGPPGSKPFYPYSTLIRYAIKGSPTGKLLLEDIYYAIESRFPYFRTAPPGWKNSVRHNLSLNPCFVKLARPLSDRGKGNYWTVDDTVDPRTGVHRVRKKKPKKSKDDPTTPTGSSQEIPTTADFTTATSNGFEDTPVSFPTVLDDGQRAPVFAAQFPPPYDPTFPLLGMRFPALHAEAPSNPGEVHPDGQNIDWRAVWHKELDDLRRQTEEQDKASAGDDWYRAMFYRLRAYTLFHYAGPPTDLLALGVPVPPTDLPGAGADMATAPTNTHE